MGITNLNTLLREKTSDAFIELEISAFKGKRIVFDSNNVLYVYVYIAWKRVVMDTDILNEDPDPDKVTSIWLEEFKKFLFKILQIGITPIFVFDGKSHHLKDKYAKKIRIEKKNKTRDEIEVLLAKVRSIDPLLSNAVMINDIKKKISTLTPMSVNELEVLKSVLTGIGIPVLTAVREAEQLCSTLNRLGLVDAVYSTDTDNLVHGCKVLITGMTNRIFSSRTQRMEENFKITLLEPVLKGLRLTSDEFADVCIMAGCDYNENMKLIGIKKSYKLICDHKSIDKLPERYDITCLNHQKKYDLKYSDC